MKILNFLLSNLDSVLVVVGFLIFIVVLIKRGETKILKSVLFALVTQAERQFGSGTGTLKFATVADWIYQRIPLILRILFTKKDIERMIESTLEIAKGAWSTNDNIKGYIEAGEEPSIIIGEVIKEPIKDEEAKEVKKE